MTDSRAPSPERSALLNGARACPDVVALERVTADRSGILELLDHLLRPRWAEYRDASLSVEQVSLRDVMPVASMVEAQRLARTRELAERFVRSGVERFEPALVRVGDDCRLVVPPVLESSARGLEVVDGMHRLYALHELGMAKVTALVARRARFAPPAGTPRSWEEVRASGRGNVPREEKFVGYAPERFRPVAPFFAGTLWTLGPWDDCLERWEAWVDELRSRIEAREALGASPG